MRYFNLKLVKPEGDVLFESDLPSAEFATLMRQLASILIQQKAFVPRERYDARLIPQTDNNPNFGKASILEGPNIPQNGEGFLDILFFEEDEPVLDPITYLTIQLRSADRNIAYQLDMRLESIFSSILTRITQTMIDDGALEEGDRFRLHLTAHKEGRPRVDPLVTDPSKVATVNLISNVTPHVVSQQPSSTQPVADDEVVVTLAEPIIIEQPKEEEIDIVIESVEELIKPETRSLTVYSDKEIVGQINDGDIPIFVRRGAMERISREINRSAQVDEEVGGFLVGNVFRDAETDRLFVEIAEVVEADQAEGTFVSIDFDYKAWHKVLNKIDNDFPDKFPVGWYHTHLISQILLMPVPETELEFEVRLNTFFSQADMFIHQNFFPDPWHVALVMDLRCGRDVFFAWRDGQVTKTSGFYLYGE